MFVIREGIYTVPNVGRIVTFKGVSNETLLKLYECKGFPFISPVVGKKLVSFLKKQKLSNKRVACLITAAKSVEEVDMLLLVKTSKVLENIADARKKAISK